MSSSTKMDKNKKPKKSTYEILTSLDKKVKKGSTKKRDHSSQRSSNEYRRRNSPSPLENQDNFRKSNRIIPEIVIDDIDYDIPDRSFGDLYCKICDSHMNSKQKWESHITGKRHQKHVKKGETDSKYDIIDEDPIIQAEIRNCKEILIGLQHCCEIQRLEGKPQYQCFLCSSNFANDKQCIEHIIGLKHRLAYLKEHDKGKHDLIVKADLKKGMIEPVVAECVAKHCEKYGPGTMQVKVEKPKPPEKFQSYKRHHEDDYEPRKKRDDRLVSYPGDLYNNYRRGPDLKSASYFSERDPYESRHHLPHTSSSKRNWGPVDTPRDKLDSPSTSRRPLSPPFAPSPSYRRMESKALLLEEQKSSWGQPAGSSGDLRSVLEQRKIQEKNQSSSSNTNLFESIISVIESMPSMLFLEIVLHRVENMNPTDAELSLLQKIGNHMISIVMNKKLQNLSPDILDKYQQKVTPSVAPGPMDTSSFQNSSKSANLSSLMNLIDQFKSAEPPTRNSATWNLDQRHAQGRIDDPAYSTQSQNSLYSGWKPSQQIEIPGLNVVQSIRS